MEKHTVGPSLSGVTSDKGIIRIRDSRWRSKRTRKRVCVQGEAAKMVSRVEKGVEKKADAGGGGARVLQSLLSDNAGRHFLFLFFFPPSLSLSLLFFLLLLADGAGHPRKSNSRR